MKITLKKDKHIILGLVFTKKRILKLAPIAVVMLFLKRRHLRIGKQHLSGKRDKIIHIANCSASKKRQKGKKAKKM